VQNFVVTPKKSKDLQLCSPNLKYVKNEEVDKFSQGRHAVVNAVSCKFFYPVFLPFQKSFKAFLGPINGVKISVASQKIRPVRTWQEADDH